MSRETSTLDCVCFSVRPTAELAHLLASLQSWPGTEKKASLATSPLCNVHVSRCHRPTRDSRIQLSVFQNWFSEQSVCSQVHGVHMGSDVQKNPLQVFQQKALSCVPKKGLLLQKGGLAPGPGSPILLPLTYIWSALVPHRVHIGV